jgi:hypothetical protein
LLDVFEHSIVDADGDFRLSGFAGNDSAALRA